MADSKRCPVQLVNAAARATGSGVLAKEAAYSGRPDFYEKKAGGRSAAVLAAALLLTAVAAIAYSRLHGTAPVEATAANSRQNIADAAPDADTEAAWVEYLRQLDSAEPGQAAASSMPTEASGRAPASLAPAAKGVELPAVVNYGKAPVRATNSEKLARLVAAIPTPVKASLAAIPPAERAQVVSGVKRMRLFHVNYPNLQGDKTSLEVNGHYIGVLDEGRTDAPVPYVFQPEEITTLKTTVVSNGSSSESRFTGLTGPDGRTSNGPRIVGSTQQWIGVIHLSQGLPVPGQE